MTMNNSLKVSTSIESRSVLASDKKMAQWKGDSFLLKNDFPDLASLMI